MAANAGRYPMSAQRRVLGVPRSTYYHMLAGPPAPPAPDPVLAALAVAWTAAAAASPASSPPNATGWRRRYRQSCARL